jgi:hypothetical protein
MAKFEIGQLVKVIDNLGASFWGEWPIIAVRTILNTDLGLNKYEYKFGQEESAKWYPESRIRAVVPFCPICNKVIGLDNKNRINKHNLKNDLCYGSLIPYDFLEIYRNDKSW